MRYFVVALIKVYQYAVSPMLPDACGFYPTCSQYACEAVEKHGSVRGSWLALLRLLRCNPWSCGGIDLVPHPSKGAPV